MIPDFLKKSERKEITSEFFSYFDDLSLYVDNIFSPTYFKGLVDVTEAIPSISTSLYFASFQFKLFNTFLGLLLLVLLLIYIAWQIYGKPISERFMKPSTHREIEELKASVSKLKLPKDHTPRI